MNAPVTQLEVMAALDRVYDPELGMSLVELQLITAVGVEAKRILVITKLTTPFCPYVPQIFADVKEKIGQVTDLPVEIEIDLTPWDPVAAGLVWCL